MMAPAAVPTARMARELKRKTSITPRRAATNSPTSFIRTMTASPVSFSTLSRKALKSRKAARRAGHLDDAVGVVGDGAEGVHGQDVGGRHQHAHGGYGRPEDAAVREV